MYMKAVWRHGNQPHAPTVCLPPIPSIFDVNAVYGDPAICSRAGPIILTICQISASKMPGESSRAHKAGYARGEHLSRF